MVRQLSIVSIEGKSFYVDERLNEYRQVENPNNRISFDELDRKPVLLKESQNFKILNKNIKTKGKGRRS